MKVSRHLCPLMVITGHGVDVTDQRLQGRRGGQDMQHHSGSLCVFPVVHLHGGPQQDVSALVGGHLGVARLPIISHLHDDTATVEDVHLGAGKNP